MNAHSRQIVTSLPDFDAAIAKAMRLRTEAKWLRAYEIRKPWEACQTLKDGEIAGVWQLAHEAIHEARDIRRRAMAHAIGVRAVEEAVS